MKARLGLGTYAVRGLILGGLGGALHIVTQTLLAILTGSVINLAFFLSFIAVYAILCALGGLILSPFLFLLVRAVSRMREIQNEESLLMAVFAVLPFSVNGFIMVQVQVMTESSMGQPSGIAVTVLWWTFVLALGVALYRIGSRVAEGRPPLRIFALWCLAINGALVGMLAVNLKDVRGVLAWPLYVLFVVVAAALLFRGTPRVALRASSGKGPWLFRGAWLAVAAGLYAAAVIVLSATTRVPPLRVDRGAPGKVEGNGTNVVLIVLDTARAENMSVYGYHRATTPFLEAFARDAVRFTRHYATAPWTIPSHASLFTSLYTHRHGVDYPDEDLMNQDLSGKGRETVWAPQPLLPRVLTLAEILSASGYNTGAITANFAAMNRGIGLAQGFAFYDDSPRLFVTTTPERMMMFPVTELLPLPLHMRSILKPYRLAEEIRGEGLQWISEHRDRPFFLFLNFMECHHPFEPPIPYDRRFPGKAPFVFSEMHLVYKLMKGRGVSQRDRDHLLSQYDGEMAYLDDQLRLFMDRLKSMGLYDDALIIITSDHGEMLGEHDQYAHPTGLYNELLWTPLIIKYPRAYRDKAGVVDEYVQLVDVAPTILDVLGLAVPAGFQGNVVDEVVHPIVSEFNPQKHVFYYGLFHKQIALFEKNFKFIRWSRGKTELYDLNADPEESKDLSEELPGVVKERTRELQTWYESMTPIREEEPGETEQIDSEMREKLRALGYL